LRGEIVHKIILQKTASNLLTARQARETLPKLVTRNVTDAEVGGIVFRSKIIRKNSINEADEKKPTENNYG
jgi:hypothetical protein